jgi:hypothetical protein
MDQKPDACVEVALIQGLRHCDRISSFGNFYMFYENY